MIRRTNNDGFALPVAIFALVVVGVLVTSAFFTSRQESRIGQSTERTAAAFYSTERGINALLAQWEQADYNWLDDWEDTTLTGTVDDVAYAATVTRLSDMLYFVDATGTYSEGNLLAGASRRIGVVVRLRTANINPPAALTVQGAIQIGGSSEIAGFDSVPANWPAGLCDTTDSEDKAGIVTDDTTQITYSGQSYEISGSPAIKQDTTLTNDYFTDFGDLGWNDLVAAAEKVYANGVTITSIAPDSTFVNGSYQCNKTRQSNWGHPLSSTSVCYNYFPIIYGQGDLKISSSGFGQGILVVEGNLEVTGGFEFFGPVMVKGRLKTTGTGGHFNGGVMAANVDLATSQVLGNAVVQFSSCSIRRAVMNNTGITRVRPLANRSWIDLSSLTY
ncbi:MAG: hypothetical protein HY704_17210 [Gemmatimonadetes bacterium]|nr:hypothetical protein [Gemmatimonadota bacterium]